MADARASGDGPVSFRLDGRVTIAPSGSTVLEAADAQGIDIPRLCHHPALGGSGRCRLCVVEASPGGLLVPSCSTVVAEGAQYRTDTETVRRARASAIELLLANHPPDCPSCDLSGACAVQDLSFRHGGDRGPARDPVPPGRPEPAGPAIALRRDRCILCLRCVRFCEEVGGARGLFVDWAASPPRIAVVPGASLDGPLAGNLVDLCPSGALVSRDFVQGAPAWALERTPTVCAACARGCAIEARSFRGEVRRVVARPNPAVNGHWICDLGRGATRPAGPGRLLAPRPADAAAAVEELAGRLLRLRAEAGPAAIAGIASASLTLEELLLFRRVFEALGTPAENIAAIETPPGAAATFPGGFRVSSDRDPDGAGVAAILGPEARGARLERIAARVESGEVRGLVVVCSRPRLPFGASPAERQVLERAAALDVLVAIELEPAGFPPGAVVFPATTPFEKDGSFLNEDQRLQRLRRAVAPPPGVRPELDLFQDLLRRLGARDVRTDAAGVFREVARELGLGGLSLDDLGALGIPIRMPEAAERREARS